MSGCVVLQYSVQFNSICSIVEQQIALVQYIQYTNIEADLYSENIETSCIYLTRGIQMMLNVLVSMSHFCALLRCCLLMCVITCVDAVHQVDCAAIRCKC